jgi:hypothetical protein
VAAIITLFFPQYRCKAKLADRVVRILRSMRLMVQVAADEGDGAPALPTALERPINDPAEDKLERAALSIAWPRL